MSTNPLSAGTGRAHRLQRDARGRIDLKCLTRPELAVWLALEIGGDEALAQRVFQAIWQRGARTFDEMTDVAARWRARLEPVAYLSMLEPDIVLASDDGTRKYLWRLEDGARIESVLIPDGDRVTLCMSSQVGCAMACTFCLTGDLGLKRNLKASEIANQALQVGLQYQRDTGRRITNLVMMGMGEPLHNLPNLIPALTTCLDDLGLNFSHRRVTVSTVGLVDKMAELAAALPVNLAVSVNATTEEQRERIMPITRKHSLAELVLAMERFPLPHAKRITVEYVMIEGFNDTLDDADRLRALLRRVSAKVNLIPYNENPDRDLRTPPPERVKAFQHRLVTSGLSCSIRTTRGTDISAACGQLGKARQQALEQGWLSDARRLAGYAPDADEPAVATGSG
jgi:23S rRNA (adenine2503-C2)-methyltransferase